MTVAEPSAEINWAEVERFANVGADEDAIVTGLGLETQIKDPAVAERLRSLVVRGNARKDLLLREAIDKLGKGETRGGGNTLALEARNRLGWDKQSQTEEAPPDLMEAHARLKLTLERLAKAKSEELGREVTPAEILVREVYPSEEKVH